jgi:hypothetical protein
MRSTQISNSLSKIADEMPNQGVIVSLTVRKKGVVRQGKTYDNDLVQVVLWTGFSYQALVERSLKRLRFIQEQGNIIHNIAKESGKIVTVGDAAEALQDVEANFLKILRGGDTANKPSESVWEPLKVNGMVVPGAKVYVSPDQWGSKTNIPLGTIYLDGLKLGEKVLEPAPNGSWATQHKAKTLAKETLKSWLPIGQYVRYCLEPKAVKAISIGKEAVNASKGLPIDLDAIRLLFKVAD